MCSSDLEGEPNEPEEESDVGLNGGLTRILCRGVSLPTGNRDEGQEVSRINALVVQW